MVQDYYLRDSIYLRQVATVIIHVLFTNDYCTDIRLGYLDNKQPACIDLYCRSNIKKYYGVGSDSKMPVLCSGRN